LKVGVASGANAAAATTTTVGRERERQRERERGGLFTMSEYNKYIYKLDNGRLPERNNHHSWPPMIIEKNNH